MLSITDYKFYSQVIVRTPFYRVSTYDESLNDILHDSCFTSAILLSSKSLYQSLEKKGFIYNNLAEKEIFTVKQYFNRMCFRPTPFGLFAGISITSWNEGISKICFDGRLQVKTLVNYEHGVLIAEQITGCQARVFESYILNPSLYKVNNEYRYIKYMQKEDGVLNFYIESIELTSTVANILSYFKEDHLLTDLINFLIAEYDITLSESERFTNELIERQIILSELLPNITGQEYCGRVMEKMEAAGFSIPNKFGMHALLSINTKPLGDFIRSIADKSNGVEKLSGFRDCNKSPLYVNMERNCQMNGMSYEMQEKIEQALYCLDKLVPGYQNDTLVKFKKDFRKKFDLRWIPLMVALDPEVGVDYCSMGKVVGECELVDNILGNRPDNDVKSIQWSRYQTFLLNKWNTSLTKASGIPTIELKEDELEALGSQEVIGTLPPSMAVLFRTVGTAVYIEEAGGASAASIMGRFTVFNKSIKAATEELSEIEQSANPEIIFAEIAHFSGFKTANINRRAAVRQYEIPVVTGAGVDKQHQIALNDLWVSVVEDEIIIWSKRLQKRIIPRLSSAFNYIRNDLPVFRFLCDLQFQGIRSNFSLDLYALFPGLSFYPRIQYKDSILHLASWHINKETVGKILAFNRMNDKLTALKELAKELNWPEFISVNRHDNYIVIDVTKREELLFLLKLFQKNESLIIKEFPFAGTNKNRNNVDGTDNYIAQYVAILYHRHQVYHRVTSPLEQIFSPKKITRNFPPGSAWNYFKIYCHPTRSNEILIKYILPLCERWLNTGFIKKWFFVRYADPDHHLRIRVNGDPINTGILIKGFNNIMTPLIDAGIVCNFEQGVYEREMERYGKDIIEYLEKAFFAGTRLIISFIGRVSEGNKEKAQFEMAFCNINILLDCFKYNVKDKIDLFERFYMSMKSEFAISEIEEERLKRRFREFRKNSSFLSIDQLIDRFKLDTEAEYFRYTHREIYRMVCDSPPERKAGLIGDIIHMHLNRLFVSYQRKNELVIYYCLWRHYASEAGRRRAVSSGLFADQHCINKSQ